MNLFNFMLVSLTLVFFSITQDAIGAALQSSTLPATRSVTPSNTAPVYTTSTNYARILPGEEAAVTLYGPNLEKIINAAVYKGNMPQDLFTIKFGPVVQNSRKMTIVSNWNAVNRTKDYIYNNYFIGLSLISSPTVILVSSLRIEMPSPELDKVSYFTKMVQVSENGVLVNKPYAPKQIYPLEAFFIKAEMRGAAASSPAFPVKIKYDPNVIKLDNDPATLSISSSLSLNFHALVNDKPETSITIEVNGKSVSLLIPLVAVKFTDFIVSPEKFNLGTLKQGKDIDVQFSLSEIVPSATIAGKPSVTIVPTNLFRPPLIGQVPGAAKSYRFHLIPEISSLAPYQDKMADITVQVGNIKMTKQVELIWQRKLKSLTVTPKNTLGVQTARATVTLDGPAPREGMKLGVSGTADLGTTGNVNMIEVLVPAGSTNVDIPLPQQKRPGDKQICIFDPQLSVSCDTINGLYADMGWWPKSDLTSLEVYPTTIESGGKFTLKFPLSNITVSTFNSGYFPGGEEVTLQAIDPQSPASVILPAKVMVNGSNVFTTSLSVDTLPVTTARQVTIKASANGKDKYVMLNLTPAKQQPTTPIKLVNMTLQKNTTFATTEPVSATLCLDRNVPVPAVVQLASDKPATLNLPASVSIPAGKNCASFTFTTLPVIQNEVVMINSVYNGSSVNASLTIYALPK